MAVIVETGAIIPNANAYCDAAYVLAYATARGLDFATGADADAAVVKATDYIDSRYTFNGGRVSSTQELAWPRTGAWDRAEQIEIASNAIPSVLKRAVAELAIKALAGTALVEDLARGGKIQSQSVGEISVTYETGDGIDVGTKFGITGLLKGLIRNTDEEPIPYTSQPNDSTYFKTGMFDNNGVP
jgi:hypothetical protein